jgi:sulfur-oxidizing protein SoxZ
MASTIRVRAILSGETTEVQALIQHPMDSGFIKDAKGEIIPPHYIRELTFEHDGKSVFVADWGPAVSKDPYVKFSFKGGKKGEELKISWVDNKGTTDTTIAKIQKRLRAFCFDAFSSCEPVASLHQSGAAFV